MNFFRSKLQVLGLAPEIKIVAHQVSIAEFDREYQFKLYHR
jgi:hypothetical protein